MIETDTGSNIRRQRFEERFTKSKNTAVTWAAVFLWGAVSLIVDTLINDDAILDGGMMFVLGAGAILIISGLAILVGRDSRQGVMFRMILGTIFLGIGAGEITNLSDNIVVATILVLLAVVILMNAFRRGNRPSERS